MVQYVTQMKTPVLAMKASSRRQEILMEGSAILLFHASFHFHLLHLYQSTNLSCMKATWKACMAS